MSPPSGSTNARRCAAAGSVSSSSPSTCWRTVRPPNAALAQLYVTTDRGARTDRAVAALRTVGLGHRLDALPPTLSGGERQSVAVARALVNRPELILCDEPTGNLDSATSAHVMNLLEELHAAGLTVVVITHDPAVAERARRVLTIRDGRILTDTDRRAAA